MRPDLVVLGSPSGNDASGLRQGLKPVLIEALVPEGAVEALDVGVLGRAAGLDQDVFYAVLLGPGKKRPASEFWSVVGSDLLGVAPKRGGTVQQPGDVQATNAEVHANVHTLVAEVIGHREAFDAPRYRTRLGDGIAHKVHAPGLVERQRRHQRHTHANALGLFAFSDGQRLSGVDAIQPLVVNARVLGAKYIVDHSVAPAPVGVRSLHDVLAQLHIECAGGAGVAVGVSA